MKKPSPGHQVFFAITTVVVAASLSIVTAILPIYASVPSVIYANSVPTYLVSIALGPLAGTMYAVASNIIINSIGMGSGAVLYVVVFKALVAFIIGLLWHNKQFNLIRYVLTVVGTTFLLKPVSYVLAYFGRQSLLGDKTLFEYVSNSYINFLHQGWVDTLLLYATGILVAILLTKGLRIIFRQKEN